MNETIEKLKADYDAVAYDSWEHYHAHPDRIAVVAALRGLIPPSVKNCRVLEIACATGGNLFPMAEQMPASRFLGIDLSPLQIESGQAIVRELGLTNLELRCQDLMDFPDSAGSFDYIIAHGFYSWVPDPVRKQLLNVCRKHLTENGLAFISYNTFPGWRLNGVMRDMMLYNARNATDPAERIQRGREIVQFAAEHTIDKNYYHDMVSAFQKIIPKETDSYLLHDQMELVNDAVYLRDFVSEAQSHGLTHIGDANANDDHWSRVPAPVREAISKLSADTVERDQYMDFLTNRTFRRSVLCRAEAASAAHGEPATHIRELHIAGHPTESNAGINSAGKSIIQFGTAEKIIQLSDPRPIAAMRHLCKAWPSAVPFSELVAATLAQTPANQRDPEKTAVALAHIIETCHVLAIVELWTHATDHISPTASEHPHATRWARWQATHQHRTVASLRHTPITLDDIARKILSLLDGMRNRQALAEELARTSEDPSFRDPRKARQLIDSALPSFASYSLLTVG